MTPPPFRQQRIPGQARPAERSGQHFVDHFLWLNTSEPLIGATVEVGQEFVIQPHQMQDRSVQFRDVAGPLDGLKPEFVGSANRASATDSATRSEPETAWQVGQTAAIQLGSTDPRHPEWRIEELWSAVPVENEILDGRLEQFKGSKTLRSPGRFQ